MRDTRQPGVATVTGSGLGMRRTSVAHHRGRDRHHIDSAKREPDLRVTHHA